MVRSKVRQYAGRTFKNTWQRLTVLITEHPSFAWEGAEGDEPVHRVW